MPWCDECAKFWNPGSMKPDGSCPSCGRVLATKGALRMEARMLGEADPKTGTKADGQVCAAGAECSSGNCVDGYCCNSTCTTACKACNVAGSLGTCSNMAQFAQDNFPVAACIGVSSCNGSGRIP